MLNYPGIGRLLGFVYSWLLLYPDLMILYCAFVTGPASLDCSNSLSWAEMRVKRHFVSQPAIGID